MYVHMYASLHCTGCLLGFIPIWTYMDLALPSIAMVQVSRPLVWSGYIFVTGMWIV